MASYRKKPVVIEAQLFVKDRGQSIVKWIQDSGHISRLMDYGNRIYVATLEGTMSAEVGDWIIRGVAGEFYPCKPEIFAATYVPAGDSGLSFGSALELLKDGKRLQRAGWNGKGLFVYLVPPASYPVQTGAAKAYFGEHTLVPYNAYLAIKNVDNTVSTWVPSVNDCLAEDWSVLE